MTKFLIDRIVITVSRNDGLWAAEEAGIYFGASADKEIAKASAAKRARERIQEGHACQIRVSGEHGFAI
ncbi:MAG TPA: hypothetical protein VN113_01390 [Caulobacter sp.]|nr:hypothetical protein [Caulobacter sp.]